MEKSMTEKIGQSEARMVSKQADFEAKVLQEVNTLKHQRVPHTASSSFNGGTSSSKPAPRNTQARSLVGTVGSDMHPKRPNEQHKADNQAS